ncbi:MAG: M14 family metallopeptidase [Armatimonadota bacterium]|nr:M14 family metallopeptidase [Armatimonadota bacterium]
MSETLRFDTFYPYQALTRHLFDIAARRPNLMVVESIGKSFEGRDIWCATVTNTATGPAAEKPAFWIDGNIHATELSASTACLYFLKHLVESYGTDAEVTRCLDTRAFYVVPRLNPDGAERYFDDRPTFLRSSVRPYPYDEEPLEGLRREDIDGDGRFLTMRVPDPNGPWKVHPEEPRLMVRRDPTETGGQYYRLLPEGILENWDGVTVRIRPQKEGLDLNRNFPAHWRQEHEQHGAGPYPTSEPEVRAAVAFITSHPNITGGVAFHTFSGVLLRPFSAQSDENFPAEDLWTYQKIGQKGEEITGYPAVSVYHDFRYHPREVITGVFDDWMYDHLGLFAWTVEIWSPQRQAGITDYKFIDWYREHPVEDDLKLLKWNDEVLEGKGFVPWYPFQHPQLGTIELGGWDALYALRNPPPPLLEQEVARFPRWLVWHALISPRLKLHLLEATPLGGDAYRVRLVVDNTGWLPTYVTKKALDRKATRGIVVEIEVPEDATLETGKRREEMGQLEGRAYKHATAFGWVSDPTQERGKLEWVVKAPTGGVVRVVARHDRAGTVRGEVLLPGRP